MASPVTTYQAEMHKNLGFYATWFPTDPIAPGDIGVFEGGCFRRMTTLAELGVGTEVEVASAQADMQYTSSKGIEVNASAAAGVVAVGQAEVVLSFSDQGAFLFHASGVELHRLANRLALQAALADLQRKGQWEKEWLIVEAVYAAKCATVVLSNSQSAKVVISAQSKVPTGAPSLADPQAKFGVSTTHGQVFQVVGADNLTPLYACLRLSSSFLGAPKLQPVRGESDSTPAFERPALAELLNS